MRIIRELHTESLSRLLKPKNSIFVVISCGLVFLNGCRGLSGASSGDIAAVNHVIFMLQENRSFDTYFGQLNA